MLIVALYGALWEDFHASLQYVNKPVGMKSGIFNLLKCNSRKLIDLPKYNQTPSPHCFQFETFAAATPLYQPAEINTSHCVVPHLCILEPYMKVNE